MCVLMQQQRGQGCQPGAGVQRGEQTGIDLALKFQLDCRQQLVVCGGRRREWTEVRGRVRRTEERASKPQASDVLVQWDAEQQAAPYSTSDDAVLHEVSGRVLVQ